MRTVDPSDQPTVHPALPVPLAAWGQQSVPILPAPLTTLVGREREVAALRDVLLRPEVRLATLVGPGGVGKTRLALRTVAELDQEFPDGLWFVPLASITDPALVLPTVAQTIGVRGAGDRPLPERLASFLGGQTALLVLDNFEQVLDAAPDLGALLGASPGVTILVTSRARLRIAGEQVVPVPPLALPEIGRRPVEELAGTAAVTLFVERSRAARPDFDLTPANATSVVEVCRRLDGLPLAIELAAGWSAVLSPAMLRERLRERLPLLTTGPVDAPERLRTMRDAIAWSYDLLTTDEQAFFRRAAVFVGGFTLEAAEELGRGAAGRDLASLDALNAVAGLVDKSLLRREPGSGSEPRYAMLETVREFGLERLRASGEEAAVRDAHAAQFLQLAEREWEALASELDSERWTGRLAVEHDNLRAALAWLADTGSTEQGLRLSGALGWFWYFADHWAEGSG